MRFSFVSIVYGAPWGGAPVARASISFSQLPNPASLAMMICASSMGK
jgi:hypothetical protein